MSDYRKCQACNSTVPIFMFSKHTCGVITGIGQPQALPPEPGKLEEEVVNEEFFREIIIDWKHDWMNQRQNSQADYENYHRRAFGIDANMQYDLARRLMAKHLAGARSERERIAKLLPPLEKAYLEADKKDALLASQGERIKELEESLRQCVIERDNPYCPVCGSCGETGCCPGKRCLYPDIKAETISELESDNTSLRAALEQVKAERDELKKIVERVAGEKAVDTPPT